MGSFPRMAARRWWAVFLVAMLTVVVVPTARATHTQRLGDAAYLWDWAPIGTTVVVMP